LTLEDGTDRLSPDVGNLKTDLRCITSQKNKDLNHTVAATSNPAFKFIQNPKENNGRFCIRAETRHCTSPNIHPREEKKKKLYRKIKYTLYVSYKFPAYVKSFRDISNQFDLELYSIEEHFS
jgi:hypothetical protein